ncbi:MAG: 7-cyano-7-deazaguanine synthase QueC [bacterium]|nr:7-cyano-7-deazaguanine synthase QueC [bacterium]
MQKAIILMSGGMDSAVTAGIAAERYEPCFLHVNYGQRTEKRELRAFRMLARYYHVKERLVTELGHFKSIGGSALTDKNIKVPRGFSRKGIPVTYVPFRNANLLAVAVSWAEVIGAERIFIGATEEDSAGYPDCRSDFYNAVNQLIRKGTRTGKIRIVTPVIRMNKTQIIRKGMELNVPFRLTWSCYSLESRACGECDSCLRRLKAFQEAGFKDPVPYRKKNP